MKKLIYLVLALAMIMVIGTVFATEPPAAGTNTIEVKNAAAGETYAAYKMLDLSYSGDDGHGNPQQYTYTVNSAWENFFNSDTTAKAVFSIDDQGYVTSSEPSETSWYATTSLSKFAEAAAKYAKDNNLTPEVSKTASGNSVELKTGAGYYLITSTLGSRAMVDTTPGDVEINEKNDVDSIEKEVKEDSTGNYGAENDAQIGDQIDFKTIASIAPRSVNVKIHDTMTGGLHFNDDIKIYTDAALTTELASSLYTVQATPDTGDTFTIQIDDAVAATITGTQELYITYSATLDENAIANDVSFAENKNKTTITFGANGESTEASTTTKTHKFSLFKHAKDSTDNLAGAVFELKKNGTALKLVKLDDQNYRIANEGETGTVADFTTVVGGDIVIWGVDADSDYTLNEKEPPEGYHKLSNEVNVDVKADNSTQIDVENNSGTELPSTGGMGTTIFYVIGGILLVGAAIVLVARRKAND